MARLTVDEEVWQDILSIAVRLRVSKHLVSGPLFDLWHNSQRRTITHINEEEFYDLCEIEEEEHEYKIKLFKYFIKKNFLIEEPDGRYYIRGNQKHIDGIEAKRANGSRGGRPKKKPLPNTDSSVKEPTLKVNVTPANQNESIENQKEPSVNQDAKLGLPLHNNTIHNNTFHNNTNHRDADKPQPNLKPDKLISLWNSKAPPNKQYNSHFFSAKHAKIFLETTGFPDFCNIEQWEHCLDLAFSCEWLAQQGPLSLTWIIEHHNAIDVLSGKYSKTNKLSDKNIESDIDWTAMQEDD